MHTPVLTDRVLDLLASALTMPGSVVVDATVGLGGHTAAMLDRFPELEVIGLDRDPEALAHSERRLRVLAPGRFHLVHAVYDEIDEVLARLGRPTVQGVLFDLGVSSLQLDTDERGFAYSRDAPLDMRMDGGTGGGQTAADILNTYDAAGLTRILRHYGEERFARRIADSIVRARTDAPFTTSARLVELVRDAIPAPARRSGGNPAKRTFQALRIEVNTELDVLARAVPAAFDALGVGGRLVVLSYHSLEDRIVKQRLAPYAQVLVPPEMPVIPAGAAPRLRWLTRGAEPASEAEKADNPRAASVRLRAAERIAPNPGSARPTTGGVS
ncbi:16S rRNA m4C1402 methyltransferase [Frankia sp. AiPs1]|uniref:16S rRNA (cytosine(1402)-N(4))-methyltransferase RsmH n=1 Tax=Frankia sp. AiPa1 TaxID=573492 RepID=UPI00202B650F|nr:16S rRNA (cytosine(1402)-N(4))-methyltransferase RsmH [Frankia sp. AiPa1]MCL9757965.1 16S rRNA (cytosine(1402)-N(4))-methyltransferase RsmH [Frankia sp. AiPa1]